MVGTVETAMLVEEFICELGHTSSLLAQAQDICYVVRLKILLTLIPLSYLHGQNLSYQLPQ